MVDSFVIITQNYAECGEPGNALGILNLARVETEISLPMGAVRRGYRISMYFLQVSIASKCSLFAFFLSKQNHAEAIKFNVTIQSNGD